KRQIVVEYSTWDVLHLPYDDFGQDDWPHFLKMHPCFESSFHFLLFLTMFKPRAERCFRRGWEISCICPTFHWSWTILNFFIFLPWFHCCSRHCCTHFICSWGGCPFCKTFH